jgi:cardiolipin synthase
MISNIPNILTFTRILILPFFAASLIYKEYDYALMLFVVAAITDLLDGLVARITKQITDFGKILDPIADKFFLLTSFILMSVYELMPKWLTIIVISKDLIVITGSVILYFVTNKLKVEPSIWGKYASALQFILIGLILLSLYVRGSVDFPLAVFVVVAVITSISGVDYVVKGLRFGTSELNNKVL